MKVITIIGWSLGILMLTLGFTSAHAKELTENDFLNMDIGDLIDDSIDNVDDAYFEYMRRQNNNLKYHLKGFTGRNKSTDTITQFEIITITRLISKLNPRVREKIKEYKALTRKVRLGMLMNMFSPQGKMDLRKELWKAYEGHMKIALSSRKGRNPGTIFFWEPYEGGRVAFEMQKREMKEQGWKRKQAMKEKARGNY